MSRKKNINSEMRGTDSRHFQPKQHEKRHFYTATLSQTNYCELVDFPLTLSKSSAFQDSTQRGAVMGLRISKNALKKCFFLVFEKQEK